MSCGICELSARSIILVFLLSASTSQLFASTPRRQEAVRDLNNANHTAKFLSPGEVDSWLFDGKKNETVIVNVSTAQFDPVIGLAKINGESEKIMFSIDDDGSTSQFSFRLTEDGEYKIRVHGFEMKGGGNYNLNVERFTGQPIEIGQRVTGEFDQKGEASFFLDCRPDDNLMVDTNAVVHVFEPNGNSLNYTWHSNLLIDKDGEHLIVLNGQAGSSFSLTVQPAVRASLEIDKPIEVETKSRSLNIWEIQAQPGQFRYITVTRSFDLESQLIYAPLEAKTDRQLDQESNYQEIQLFPVSSKGDVSRYVVMFGRQGRYQLQTYSHQKAKVNVAMIDPTIAIDRGASPEDQISIGGTHFYGFDAKAGDLLESRLTSRQFDCWLRLYDERGQLVSQNDDSRDTKNSEITTMITRNGKYRWQVSSLGDGGGGDYKLAFNEIELKHLKVGDAKSCSRDSNTTDYWSLDGESGKSLFINVTSTDFDPIVAVYGPNGRRLQIDDSSGVQRDSLIAVKLPSSGRYTVWVWSNRNGGNYKIRILDADWQSE